MRDASERLRSDSGLFSAIKLFLEGRHTIETTWGLREDLRLRYPARSRVLRVLNRWRRRNRIVVQWFSKVVLAHRLLQAGEASWTLCNFAVSEENYLAASEKFFESESVLSGLTGGFHNLTSYSQAWGGIAKGMYENVCGFAALRADNLAEGAKRFQIAKQHLESSEFKFAQIGNTGPGGNRRN